MAYLLSQKCKIDYLTIMILSVILTPSHTVLSAADTWKLVWSDEFNGDKLDYSKWGIAVNAFGGGNNELQLYTDRPKNIRVGDGHLTIEAHRDNPNIVGVSREYSSGRLRSKHRGDWKYGRFVIRAKLPTGQGIWPAIWMLPTKEKYGGWALSGEIDIMEFNGAKPDHVLGTLHFGDKWPNNRSSSGKFVLPKGSFVDDFHLFALEWEKGVMRWYVDNKLYQTKTKWDSKTAPFPAPFDQDFHLLLNLSIGGNFVGAPDTTTVFPQQFEIDYVRVYQKNNSVP